MSIAFIIFRASELLLWNVQGCWGALWLITENTRGIYEKASHTELREMNHTLEDHELRRQIQNAFYEWNPAVRQM